MIATGNGFYSGTLYKVYFSQFTIMVFAFYSRVK